MQALGVLPHLRDERPVISNMSAFIGSSGTLFLQFRNSMLSLYSFNRLIMDKPPQGEWDVNGPAYDTILAKFHNPFELEDLVREQGYTDIRYHWYNYHVTPPMLAGAAGQAFRVAGMAMEPTSDWRGMFLCSSGVIEATKI